MNGEVKATEDTCNNHHEIIERKMWSYISSTSDNMFFNVFDRIIMVHCSNYMYGYQLDECRHFFNVLRQGNEYNLITHLPMNNNRSYTWREILCKNDGDLTIYNRGLRYMVDNVSLTKDGLVCTHGYVINLDKLSLDFYKNSKLKKQISLDYIRENEFENKVFSEENEFDLITKTIKL